jgi:cellulose synthase/poly-beta-1,6-N-acetylglucosamine synthase-like glycosyltransferase
MDLLQGILLPAGAAATLATLPGAIELMLVTGGALVGRSLPDASAIENFSLAVIIPAHNEEVLIGRCVASLFASAKNGPRCTVVVVADNCTDSTAEKARQAGARVLVRRNELLRGKGYALRFALDLLSAEGYDGFLIVDADSAVSPNLVPEIARGLLAGADAMQARYRVMPPLDSERKRLMDVAFLAINVLRPKGRDGWGLSAGILGNGFALSHATLQAVPYSADSIVEDLEYHLLLVDAGKTVRFANAATVYGDIPNDEAAQLTQRARWEGGRARVAGMWIPKLAAKVLRGKFLVAEPLLELLTLPLAYMALISLALCAFPISAFRDYGIFLLALLLAHVATAVGLSGNVRASAMALVSAPAYVFWKLTRMAAIVKSSRPGAQWTRTPRAGDGKPEVEPEPQPEVNNV